MKSNDLKAARIRRGLTQNAVAAKIGISQSSYTNKENGKTPLTVDEANLLAKVLELTPVEVNAIFFSN